MKIKMFTTVAVVAAGFLMTVCSTAEARASFSFGFGGCPAPVCQQYVVEEYQPAYVERVYQQPVLVERPSYAQPGCVERVYVPTYATRVVPARTYCRQVVVQRPVVRPAFGFSFGFGR